MKNQILTPAAISEGKYEIMPEKVELGSAVPLWKLMRETEQLQIAEQKANRGRKIHLNIKDIGNIPDDIMGGIALTEEQQKLLETIKKMAESREKITVATVAKKMDMSMPATQQIAIYIIEKLPKDKLQSFSSRYKNTASADVSTSK